MFKQYRVDLQSRSQSQPFFPSQSINKKVLANTPVQLLKGSHYAVTNLPSYTLNPYYTGQNTEAQKQFNMLHLSRTSKNQISQQSNNRLQTLSIIKPQTCIMNRHTTCSRDSIFKYIKLDQEFDNTLILRENRQLRSRGMMPRSAKRRLIQTFDKVCAEYLIPPSIDIDLLGQKQEQQKRDIIHQGNHFGQPVSADHFSKALLRSWRQLTSNLTMKDLFHVQLNRDDVEIIMKQPQGLSKMINVDHILELQNIDIDDEINFQRKRSLVETIFADKHFSAKDRELIYHIIIYQTEVAIKQQQRLDRVGLGIKLTLHKNKNQNVENLRSIITYMVQNYDHLVKRQ